MIRRGLEVDPFRRVWDQCPKRARYTGEIPDYATVLRLIWNCMSQTRSAVGDITSERFVLKQVDYGH
ncbi:MAG: hypothetical protein R2867_25340 [Caldilineaceae bacterium]